MIDIGVNLCNKSFDRDRPEAIQRALDSGVKKMILTGTSVKSSRAHLELAREYTGVLYSTAGIHPHDASSYSDTSLKNLKQFLIEPEVIAVGECGLDFNRDFSPRPKQEECFEGQLSLAADTGLPLFMHQRDAHSRFVDIIKPYIPSLSRGVVHCFTGTREEALEYLDMGFYIGITGWICDERRGYHLREFIREIPLERLMIETDAPYLLPRNLRPKPKKGRNEPAFLGHIASEIASIYEMPLDDFIVSVRKTTEQFFGLNSL